MQCHWRRQSYALFCTANRNRLCRRRLVFCRKIPGQVLLLQLNSEARSLSMLNDLPTLGRANRDAGYRESNLVVVMWWYWSEVESAKCAETSGPSWTLFSATNLYEPSISSSSRAANRHDSYKPSNTTNCFSYYGLVKGMSSFLANIRTKKRSIFSYLKPTSRRSHELC